MRRVLTYSLACLLTAGLLACGLHIAHSGTAPLPDQAPGTIRVASHNVHYILLNATEGPWSVAGWEARKPALDAAFKAVAADIIAFQEMESFRRGDDGSVNLARDYLLDRNPGYAAAATGDWRHFPSTQPIFYREDRFRLADQGWFFFSETPDILYSRTFNGSYPAFASWARFARRADGAVFTVVNVHTDYASRANRRRSVDLIADRLRPLVARGEPVVLAGDLNEWHGSALIGQLEAIGLRFAPIRGATYHFNRGLNLFGAVDHIAATRQFAPAGGPAVLRQRHGATWPSDHYPVVADFRLSE